ncbi:MAG TPA: SagB family peptide dehydrogenase [Candidatus Angelobacter sp.]|nr:SagB family peptide dehydrogenase [Candidatus Angelobacter sp.]
MLNWQDTYRLSRFVLIRNSDKGFVLESPLTNKRFPVAGASVFRILEALNRPRRLDALLDAVAEEQRAAVKSFIETCGNAGLLTRVGADGLAEEETSSLSHWEVHDLFFHASSRMGRNHKAIGGTYRLRRRVPPEPPICPPPTSTCKWLALPRPPFEDVDKPLFNHVMHTRRSSHLLSPLRIEVLGEFLQRTCSITKANGEGDSASIQKVYPSGGSLHPLRVYAAVSACKGCDPGLYLYREPEHALVPIRELDSSVQRLLSDARDAAGGLAANPPVLLIISARFRRTAWKYESIAYRLILLEAGTLFQTMYLVAAAMGLRGCALGCGDSDHFARTIASDYYTETSVAEFMLGS